MIRTFLFLAIATVLTACDSTKGNVQVNSDSSPELSIQESDVFSDEYVSSEDSERNYCSEEVSIYQEENITVSASGDWRRRENVTNEAILTLVNSTDRLLFAVSSEKVTTNVDDYISSKEKNLNAQYITPFTKANVLGQDYYQAAFNGDRFNSWQWVKVVNDTAYVISCSYPKETKGDYDSCLDLVESSDFN